MKIRLFENEKHRNETTFRPIGWASSLFEEVGIEFTPYDDFDSWTEIAASISGALTTDATIAIEHRSGQGPPEEVAGRKLWRDRKHGDGSVAIYRPTLSERG